MTENKFEEEIELQIVNRYEDGESSEFLAKEYNCHSTTILRLLDRYNVEKRNARTLC